MILFAIKQVLYPLGPLRLIRLTFEQRKLASMFLSQGINVSSAAATFLRTLLKGYLAQMVAKELLYSG